MFNGGIIRHECSRSDSSSTDYDILHEYTKDSKTMSERWLDWDILGYNFQGVSSYSVLPFGETITYNPLIVEVSGNIFESNLRGWECAVLKFDRSPFFAILDNIFEANGDILIAGLSFSLS